MLVSDLPVGTHVVLGVLLDTGLQVGMANHLRTLQPCEMSWRQNGADKPSAFGAKTRVRHREDQVPTKATGIDKRNGAKSSSDVRRRATGVRQSQRQHLAKE